MGTLNFDFGGVEKLVVADLETAAQALFAEPQRGLRLAGRLVANHGGGLAAPLVDSDRGSSLAASLVDSDGGRRLAALLVDSDGGRRLAASLVDSDGGRRLAAVLVDSDGLRRLAASLVAADVDRGWAAFLNDNDGVRRLADSLFRSVGGHRLVASLVASDGGRRLAAFLVNSAGARSFAASLVDNGDGRLLADSLIASASAGVGLLAELLIDSGGGRRLAEYLADNLAGVRVPASLLEGDGGRLVAESLDQSPAGQLLIERVGTRPATVGLLFLSSIAGTVAAAAAVTQVAAAVAVLAAAEALTNQTGLGAGDRDSDIPQPAAASIRELGDFAVRAGGDPEVATNLTRAAERIRGDVQIHLNNDAWSPDAGFAPGFQEDVAMAHRQLGEETMRLSGAPPDRVIAGRLIARLQDAIEALLPSEEAAKLQTFKTEVRDRIQAIDDTNLETAREMAIDAVDAAATLTAWDTDNQPEWLGDTEGWEEFISRAAEDPIRATARLLGIAESTSPIDGAKSSAVVTAAIMATISGTAAATTAVTVTEAGAAVGLTTAIMSGIVASTIWLLQAWIRRTSPTANPDEPPRRHDPGL